MRYNIGMKDMNLQEQGGVVDNLQVRSGKVQALIGGK